MTYISGSNRLLLTQHGRLNALFESLWVAATWCSGLCLGSHYWQSERWLYQLFSEHFSG